MNIPHSQMYYNSSQAISAANPVMVVNTNEGGMTAYHMDADGYLVIRKGNISQNLNNNRQMDMSFVAAGNRSLQNSANLVNIENLNPPAAFNPNTATFTDNHLGTYSVEVIPMGRKRFTTAHTSFRYNNITIPQGAIVVGTIQTGVNQANPNLDRYQYFNFYDANTGAQLGRMSRQTFLDSGCRNSACFDIKKHQYYDNINGADVYQEFSVADLLPGRDSFEANAIWMNIQRNLEADFAMGVYKSKTDWQNSLEGDISSQDRVLITQFFEEYEAVEMNISTAAARALVLEEFGFQTYQVTDTHTQTLDRLNNAQIDAFIEYGKVVTGNVTRLRDINSREQSALQTFKSARADFKNYLNTGKNTSDTTINNNAPKATTNQNQNPPPPPPPPPPPVDSGPGPISAKCQHYRTLNDKQKKKYKERNNWINPCKKWFGIY